MSALLQVRIPESTTILLHPTKKCVLPPGKSRFGTHLLDTGRDQHLGRFQVIRLMPVHSAPKRLASISKNSSTPLSDKTSLTTQYFNRKLHRYQPSVLNRFSGVGDTVQDYTLLKTENISLLQLLLLINNLCFIKNIENIQIRKKFCL